MKGASNGENPAVNFFFNDWHGGTMTLSRHQKGCYMDLLTAQFNNGHLTLDEIKNILGNDFAVWGILSKKFIADSEGKFYNQRLEFELLKRKKFTKSRKNNLYGGEPPPHMGNGNGLGNEIEKRKGIFISDVEAFSDYPTEMRKSFCDYWTEFNKTKTKMRFEKQETFEISKRLATWSRNDKTFKVTSQPITPTYKSPSVKMPEPMPDFYSKEYDQNLNGSQAQVYHKHLHDNGWKSKKDTANPKIIIWYKPEVA